jgi:hypothetical protein
MLCQLMRLHKAERGMTAKCRLSMLVQSTPRERIGGSEVNLRTLVTEAMDTGELSLSRADKRAHPTHDMACLHSPWS